MSKIGSLYIEEAIEYLLDFKSKPYKVNIVVQIPVGIDSITVNGINYTSTTTLKLDFGTIVLWLCNYNLEYVTVDKEEETFEITSRQDYIINPNVTIRPIPVNIIFSEEVSSIIVNDITYSSNTTIYVEFGSVVRYTINTIDGESKSGYININELRTYSILNLVITEIIIDESIADPYSRLSGEFGKDGTPETNVISWIRANSHRYVGNYDESQGMILKQLDDNDSTKYADGSDASQDIKGTNGGDVFMKMPDFWYKGETLDENRTKIMFSIFNPNDEDWVKWNGNTLIGVYKAYFDSNGLYSRSGITPTVGKSKNSFCSNARLRNKNNDLFSAITLEVHNIINLLYIVYYGDTYPLKKLGIGSSSYPKVTGNTNLLGMNDSDNSTQSINLWGIENWGGDIYEIFDNVINNNGIQICDYDGNVIETITDILGGASSKCGVQKLILGRDLKMIPDYKTYFSENNMALYYCTVSTTQKNLVNYAIQRGRNGDMSQWNIFAVRALSDVLLTLSSSNMGTRLVYLGRVSENLIKTRNISSYKFTPIDLQYIYHNGKQLLRTGFDFNIFEQELPISNLKLYGLNINYPEIEGLEIDENGNILSEITQERTDLIYRGELIGTIVVHKETEEEFILKLYEDNNL